MKEPKVAWEGSRMKCWLNEEPFKQCCCNCLNHRRLYYKNTFNYYMISDSYSWACVLPYDSEEDLGVHIPWPEHSPGCELYTPIRREGGHMEATHKISACYFPSDNTVELTWEEIETGLSVALTTAVPPELGKRLAEIIGPCVYYGAVTEHSKKKKRS